MAVAVALTVIAEAEVVAALDTRTETLQMIRLLTVSTATAVRLAATSDVKEDTVSLTNVNVVAVDIVAVADTTAKMVIIGSLSLRGRVALTTTTITITITGRKPTEHLTPLMSRDKTLLTKSHLNVLTTLFVSAAVVKTVDHKIEVMLGTITDGTTTAAVGMAGLQTETTRRRATTLSSSSRLQASKCKVSTIAAYPGVATKGQR